MRLGKWAQKAENDNQATRVGLSFDQCALCEINIFILAKLSSETAENKLMLSIRIISDSNENRKLLPS